MSDIVERLKAPARRLRDLDRYEAADEIVRLRAERDEARSRFNDLDLCRHGQAPCNALLAAEAERDRLREALTPFARPEFAGFQCGMKMWLLTTSQGEVCTTPIWSGDFDKAIAALKGDTP
jgi:hypothetical protein